MLGWSSMDTSMKMPNMAKPIPRHKSRLASGLIYFFFLTEANNLFISSEVFTK